MLASGQLLSGRYRIQERLGAGGMGAVYLATVEALDHKKVAIKELTVSESNPKLREQALEQFRKEASFLANLSHPNLVPVTDFFQEDECSYLVMAFVEGENLNQCLSRSEELKIPEDQVRAWAHAIASVLHYLHSQKPAVLFRDLKPSNVMVEKDGMIKLIDFGIARVQTSGEATGTYLQGIGTPGFAALEQHSGPLSTDARTDIYAFGATLYNLLTGDVPPDAASRAAGLSELKPLQAAAPDISPELANLAMKCLELKPERRPQNMREILRTLSGDETLQSLPGEEAVPPTETMRFSAPSQTQGSRRSSYLPLVLALGLLALLAVYRYSQKGPQSEAEAQPVTAQRSTQAAEKPAKSSTPLPALDSVDLGGAPFLAYQGLRELRVQSPKLPIPRPDVLESSFEDPEHPAPNQFTDAIEDCFADSNYEDYGFILEGWRDRLDQQRAYPTLSLFSDAQEDGFPAWILIGRYRKDGVQYTHLSERWALVTEVDKNRIHFVTEEDPESERSATLVPLSEKATLVGDLEGLPVDGFGQLAFQAEDSAKEVEIVDSLVVLMSPWEE